MKPSQVRLLSAAALALGLASGCGAAEPALLSVPAIFEGEAAARFTLPSGIAVELSEATLTIAELRMEAPASDAPRLRHPGHEGSGDVRGELLGTFSVDALDPSQALGSASLYTGEYATASLELPAAPEASLRGTATVDGEARSFELTIGVDDYVHGIPFEVELTEEAPPEELVLVVDLAHALSFADWRAPDADGDGTLTLADGDFSNTLPFGLMSTATWSLSALWGATEEP